jgi:trehalose utilization protein
MERTMSQWISRRGFVGAGAAAVGALMLGGKVLGAQQNRTVVVWSEGTAPEKVYPKDINTAIADALKRDLPDWNVVVANLSDPDQGISDELLAKTDVLIWWGHKKHGEVKDALVAKIEKRVKEEGMGFIPLHSSHFAKVNKKIMGTACSWGNYKADCKTCKIIVKDPAHPIAKGVPADFVITS